MQDDLKNLKVGTLPPMPARTITEPNNMARAGAPKHGVDDIPAHPGMLHATVAPDGTKTITAGISRTQAQNPVSDETLMTSTISEKPLTPIVSQGLPHGPRVTTHDRGHLVPGEGVAILKNAGG
jgi:hypothetical protein